MQILPSPTQNDRNSPEPVPNPSTTTVPLPKPFSYPTPAAHVILTPDQPKTKKAFVSPSPIKTPPKPTDLFPTKSAMATFSLLSIFIVLCTLSPLSIVASSSVQSYPEMTLTLVNNCPFTICPAIQPDSGHPVLERGGFCLQTVTHRSFPAPRLPWSGRIWARTGCTHHQAGPFTCATGDCGSRLECLGLGGAPPATLAQLSLHHGGPQLDLTSYGVSVVDGFNVPLTVTPHEGRGRCPVVGCRDQGLLAACPDVLQFRARGRGGPVVGCKSGCEAFGTDELCCRNMYNSPRTCRASTYSEFFKSRCPATFTYAHDSPSLTHDCSAPKELKVIFCH